MNKFYLTLITSRLFTSFSPNLHLEQQNTPDLISCHYWVCFMNRVECQNLGFTIVLLRHHKLIFILINSQLFSSTRYDLKIVREMCFTFRKKTDVYIFMHCFKGMWCNSFCQILLRTLYLCQKAHYFYISHKFLYNWFLDNV